MGAYIASLARYTLINKRFDVLAPKEIGVSTRLLARERLPEKRFAVSTVTSEWSAFLTSCRKERV